MRATILLLSIASLFSAAGRAARADDRTDMIALIDKAVQALGGEAKVARLQTVGWKSKWTFKGGGITAYADDCIAQGFEQYRAEMLVTENGKGFLALQGFDGTQAWFRANGKTLNAPKEFMTPRKRAYQVARLVQWLLPLKEKEYELFPLGEIKVGDIQAVGLRAVHKERGEVGIFFDQKTGLPCKSETRIQVENTQVHVFEYQFGEFKEFDGLRHFTKITIDIDGERGCEIELSDIRTLDKVDAEWFAKP